MDRFSEKKLAELDESKLSEYKRVNIRVENDGEEVFSGSMYDFLYDNQFQDEVIEMMEEVLLNGKSTSDGMSGEWLFVAV